MISTSTHVPSRPAPAGRLARHSQSAPADTRFRSSRGESWPALVLAAFLALALPAAGGAQDPPGDHDGHQGHHAHHGDVEDPASVDVAGIVAEAARAGDVRPPIPLTHDDLVQGVHRPEEGEFEVVVGPVDLPAGMHHDRIPVQIVELPFDGMMQGFSWAITDAEGNRLPDELLHHWNLIDPDRRELFSPVSRRVLAGGRETTASSVPGVLGYPLERGTRLLVVAMFANPMGEDFDEAYLRITLEYSDGDSGLIRPRAIFPFYLDVMGHVGEKEFPVPPGRTEVAWEGSPAIDARILGAGGHLHDYGVELRLEDVTTDRVLWRVAPNADEDGRVHSIPNGHFWWRGGIPIRSDRVYRVVSVYENPTDGSAPDAGMGVIGGVVLADPDAWPEFDRLHPDYLADLERTVTNPYRDEPHGHHGGHGGHGGHDLH